MKTAAGSATPKGSSSAVVSAIAPATCRPPPSRTSRLIRASRSSENSMPMVNSSRMTPTSAIASTASRSVTRPNTLGPMSAPARRNPVIGTIRSRTNR